MSVSIAFAAAMHPRKHAAGFTLMEILMALAIISILAMLAIPFYQDYRTRAKVASEIGMMAPIKSRVVEMFMLSGVWPTSNAEAQVAAQENYRGAWVQAVAVGDTPTAGAITLYYDKTKLPALGDNNSIVFYPQLGSSSIAWACDEGSMANEFRPHNCRK